MRTAAFGLVLCLVASGWVYWALAVWAAERWRRQRHPESAPEAGASILKPLCGLDPELQQNLASFCTQDYPRYEVLFVAETGDDPALAIAERVAAEHPNCDARLLSGTPSLGANRKVNNLAFAARHARYPLVVVSDSDMRVTPDYLRHVTAPFADADVGVVTCLYRAHKPRGLGAYLEALGIGAEFIPSVLVEWLLEGPRFGFGSTIVVRRTVLDRLGGFEAIADELADDYRITERARQVGAKQVLPNYLVDYVPGSQTVSAVTERRLRWARTIRSLRPLGALGAVVTHVFVLSALLPLLRWDPRCFWFPVATFVWRSACASWIAVRCTRDRNVPRLLWLLPLHDFWSFGIWLASLWGRNITWRGHKMTFGRGGRLVR